MQAAIVTGVSRGLGAALASELLERGFTVLGIGRASNPALKGASYAFVRFDLAEAARVDDALTPALSSLAERKPVSVCLLNNAASIGAVGTLGRLAASEVTSAGMEMLTRALAAEQQAANFRAITVRPGVIDTDMQVFARSQSPDVLPSVELFKGFHRDGRLVAPAVVASKIVARLVID